MTERQQERTAEGGVPTRIGQAVMLHRAGDREEARNRLAALWHELGPSADPLHRCTLAHYLAATQDTPPDRLAWDLTALDAAEGFVTAGRRRKQGGDGDDARFGPYGDEAGPAGRGTPGAAGPGGKGRGPAGPGEPGGVDGAERRGRTAESSEPSRPGSPSSDGSPCRGDGSSGGDGPSGGEDPGGVENPGGDERPGEATRSGEGGRPAENERPVRDTPGRDGEPRAVSTDRSVAALRALFPALHLSLVADYAALGRTGDARTHLLRARTWTAALPDGAHRQTLYADIDRLGARLDGGPGRS